MSLEQKIETLTETMQNLIGALAASGIASTNTAATVTAAGPKLKAEGKGKGKPTEPPAAEAADEPADEFGSDDGFGAEGEGEEPEYTIDDVKKSLLEMRDALRAKHGDTEGVKQARVVLAKYTSTTMDAIPEEKFADAIAEANEVIEKTKAAKTTTKKK